MSDHDKAPAPRNDIIVWMDLEMTGLDPENCHIVQLAMVLTDHDLNELGKPLDIVIWQPESVLEQMGPYVRDMHASTGLLDAIQASTTDLYQAERAVMDELCRYAQFGTARLAGNSIWQDRRFLRKYMPMLDGYLHYRMLDVSTLKELALWWYNARFQREPGAKHTAMYDIRQSIAELKFYQETLFQPDGTHNTP